MTRHPETLYLKEMADLMQNKGLSREWLQFIQRTADWLGPMSDSTRLSRLDDWLSDIQIRFPNPIQRHTPFDDAMAPLIGNSLAMQPIYRAIGLILETDITVMLMGNTGTGKDILASLIHHQSSRRNHPLVTVNCGAIPRELIESELFGVEQGAFTGADRSRPGKFEQAQHGTLFLDEIGELPLDMQVALLRVIQNREVVRVGGQQAIPLNVRLIAATNRDLSRAMETGGFRSDLYYRLMVYPIRLPDLAERIEDIVPLAIYFLQRFSKQYRIPFHSLSPLTETWLCEQPWPSNIRELENTMLRGLITAQGNPILPHMLSVGPSASVPRLPAPHPTPSAIIPLDVMEAKAISEAYLQTGQNVAKTAKALGITRATFYNKAKKYGILSSGDPHA